MWPDGDRTTRVAVVGGGTGTGGGTRLAAAGTALTVAGYDVAALSIDPTGRWLGPGDDGLGLSGAVGVLRSCAAAVPMLENPYGEDGMVAALCDLVGVPIVGSPRHARAVANDRWATRLVAETVGVRTARGQLLSRGGPYPVVDLPAVVKPAVSSSSHGIRIARTRPELVAAIDLAFGSGDRVVVEEVIAGHEVDVAVLARPDGIRIGVPALEPATRDRAPAWSGGPDPLADTTRKELEAVAVAVFDALGCAGAARVGLLLTEDGAVLNEVVTWPGFTEDATVARMFRAAGVTYPELLDALVQGAVGRRGTR